ncbi:AAA family ATPase [Aquicella lusitana]|uniref:AAA ATPase-like protein n=1 Tax=Aquicella lusitana TaxID=254246 RepID=A0A370FYJ0_9COXI|nr:ATP-binding protein [Aquicella lusitana]RDI36707.1 AAA ATPase-like protein [Aquicella lusitana]VVC72571.1 hypothetical protein AQULUS_02830 [Aquicella lusitana]
MTTVVFDNPFRPGAGHKPPYLAGRTHEQDEVRALLKQKIVTQNIVLTGLRGVGKTVLLESLQPIAVQANWLWAGTDLSESASVTEETLAVRILADISRITSTLIMAERTMPPTIGFTPQSEKVSEPITYDHLYDLYLKTPGLISDKLKNVLEVVWHVMPDKEKIQGIVFAYDEAQNLADHAKQKQYPLSLLLEVFQSLQRKQIPYLLILTGLPTLFPKLVEARTYSERMFHIIFLKQLTEEATRQAITKPIEDANCPLKFSSEAVNKIVKLSGGYPYFIQFICKETFDLWITKLRQGQVPSIPEEDIIRKLDSDFFQGRWARATDRQRSLLHVIATLKMTNDEFTGQDVAEASERLLSKPFSPSRVNQMLVALSMIGLVYKNRFGKYSLAVPLLSEFILRQPPVVDGE